MRVPIPHDEFVKKVKAIHSSYTLLEKYVGQRYIKCKCDIHETEFILDKVNNVICSKNSKCPECKRLIKRKSMSTTLKQKDFEKRILELFPKHKVLGTYVNCDTLVEAFCKEHKLYFNILPNNALYNKSPQCPGCRKYRDWSKKENMGTSPISQEWLRFVAKQKRWKFTLIKCSTNGQEHYIKNVGFVDGYHPPTNTVLEFHGDLWHGNPNRYDPKYVTFIGKTAKELYEKTKKREAKILSLGFSLITMWEMDYRLLKKNS